MVFMRPKVIRTASEARDLLDDTYRRSPKLKDWDQDADPTASPTPGKPK
jgi:type II secretory pathway component GspD/PulD (secretin)